MKKSERINKWLLIIDNETRFEPVLLLLLWLRAKKKTPIHTITTTRKQIHKWFALLAEISEIYLATTECPCFVSLKIQFYQLNEHRLHHHQAKKKMRSQFITSPMSFCVNTIVLVCIYQLYYGIYFFFSFLLFIMYREICMFFAFVSPFEWKKITNISKLRESLLDRIIVKHLCIRVSFNMFLNAFFD